MTRDIVFLKSVIVSASTKASHIIITQKAYKSKIKLNLKANKFKEKKEKKFQFQNPFKFNIKLTKSLIFEMNNKYFHKNYEIYLKHVTKLEN